jgi:SAM-dependent methyltransferase
MNPADVTQRFSNRVDDYVKYRPDYPPALIDWLRETAGVSPTSAPRVADIGAGTGISTKLFLDAGLEVFAIEPNAPMRAAAQRWLGSYPHFHAVDGRAEATTLPDASVHLVTAAQAFHWFDARAVRTEWKRILRPAGLALIFWNVRRLASTPFLEGYEKLLRTYGTDYAAVAERHADETAMRNWFGAGFVSAQRFDHHQHLDFSSLTGRLLSSSYAPRSDHPNHAPMMTALRKLFDTTAENGRVSFEYDTRAYLGRIN